MIDVETLIAAELERMVPLPTMGRADWADVLQRAGVTHGRRLTMPPSALTRVTGRRALLAACVALLALAGGLGALFFSSGAHSRPVTIPGFHKVCAGSIAQKKQCQAERHAASKSSGQLASPEPVSFSDAQSALAGDAIDVTQLSSSATLPITQQQAEATALRDDGTAVTTDVTDYPVSATDNAWGKPGADGTFHKVISDRAAWLVLIPQTSVVQGFGHQSDTSRPPVTLAELIDANTGEKLLTLMFTH